MDLIEVVKMFEKAGPVAAFIIFFVWRDYKRELVMSGRLSKYEDFLRTELVKMVKATTDALTESTAAIATLKELPCKDCGKK